MENINKRNELAMSPTDRAAVERLIEELTACDAPNFGPSRYFCNRCGQPQIAHHVKPALLNLVQRLELAEQEKAEALKDRNRHRVLAESAMEASEWAEAKLDAALKEKAEAVALLRMASRLMVSDSYTDNEEILRVDSWLAAYDAKERS